MSVIRLIGVPMDLGANRRGVDMGPSALRYAGVQGKLERLGHRVVDMGNLVVSGPEQQEYADPRCRYLDEISRTCSDLADVVSKARQDKTIPLIVGGDHSIAAGSMKGLVEAGNDFAVLWVDAHADVNTPRTSPSGNVHGMPLAAALGLEPARLVGRSAPGEPLIEPDRLVIYGVRDVDVGEKEALKRFGVKVFTMSDIDQKGVAVTAAEALRHLLRDGRDLYVSFDVDSLDPSVAPGVGTPKEGGFTYREAHLIMEMVAQTERLVALELVEVNPILDEANRTAKVAAEFIASAFGSSVL